MIKLYFVLCSLIVLGCTSTGYVTPEELTRYVAEERNQLTKKIQVSDQLVQVTYRPADLWIYQEAGGLIMDSVTYKTLHKRYSGRYYFILSLSIGNGEALDPARKGLRQYGELVQTSSFGMDDHVTLITSGQDTIPVSDFMLDRTFGLSNSTDLLICV